LRLVFAGTPEPALASLEALLASQHEVLAVLTRPDAPAGRGRTLQSSPVRRRAEAAGLTVLTPSRPREPEFVEQLRTLAPDCCPVVAYGALLPQPVLDVPPHGWVNLHFSLLPAWRGAAPVQTYGRPTPAVTCSTGWQSPALDCSSPRSTASRPARSPPSRSRRTASASRRRSGATMLGSTGRFRRSGSSD